MIDCAIHNTTSDAAWPYCVDRSEPSTPFALCFFAIHAASTCESVNVFGASLSLIGTYDLFLDTSVQALGLPWVTTSTMLYAMGRRDGGNNLLYSGSFDASSRKLGEPSNLDVLKAADDLREAYSVEGRELAECDGATTTDFWVLAGLTDIAPYLDFTGVYIVSLSFSSPRCTSGCSWIPSPPRGVELINQVVTLLIV